MNTPNFLSNISDALGPLLSGDGVTAVGLSIGTSSIKIVELKKTGKNWKLLHFGVVQLPEDAIVNREIVNQVAVIEGIRTLTQQLRLKSKMVCTGISGGSVIIKKMTVAAPNLTELREQVFWEAEQYIPFDISEVVMDYHLVSRSKDKQAEVVLVAVKKDLLENYMESIQQSGLKAKIVDVDFFALQNAFEANYPSHPSEATALVDIGASSTKIAIVQNGTPIFTKDSALGGNNVTAEIQRNLNLSYADAEVLKTGAQGVAMPQEVSELMQIMAENLAIEIKKSVDLYYASSSGAPVSSVLIAGGSAKIPDLSKIVEETLGIPTQILNPFISISYDPAVFTQEYVNAIAPLAVVPIGLALRAGVK